MMLAWVLDPFQVSTLASLLMLTFAVNRLKP